MNKIFIFDYDDTMQMTHHHYTRGYLAFLNWIVEKLGSNVPDLHLIINLLAEVNVKNVINFGFTKERFLMSFREVFIIVCNGIGITPSNKDIQEAYLIGEITFKEQTIIEEGFIGGTEEVLDFLLKKGHHLILMTKGDLQWQAKKTELMECERWFDDRIHIVDHKNKENILELVGDHPVERAWLVGNSIRSDIVPALEAGIKAIYIPCETWTYEREHNGAPENNGNLLTFDKIIEIKRKYHLIK